MDQTARAPKHDFFQQSQLKPFSHWHKSNSSMSNQLTVRVCLFQFIGADVKRHQDSAAASRQRRNLRSINERQEWRPDSCGFDPEMLPLTG